VWRRDRGGDQGGAVANEDILLARPAKPLSLSRCSSGNRSAALVSLRHVGIASALGHCAGD
jgi:hypothetical protein